MTTCVNCRKEIIRGDKFTSGWEHVHSGTFTCDSRCAEPMDAAQQRFWNYLNHPSTLLRPFKGRD
jgi:hypothetical protein